MCIFLVKPWYITIVMHSWSFGTIRNAFFSNYLVFNDGTFWFKQRAVNKMSEGASENCSFGATSVLLLFVRKINIFPEIFEPSESRHTAICLKTDTYNLLWRRLKIERCQSEWHPEHFQSLENRLEKLSLVVKERSFRFECWLLSPRRWKPTRTFLKKLGEPQFGCQKNLFFSRS